MPNCWKAGNAPRTSASITAASRISTRIPKVQAEPPKRVLPRRPGCLGLPVAVTAALVIERPWRVAGEKREREGGGRPLPVLVGSAYGQTALPSAFTLLVQVPSICFTSAA